MAEKKQKNSKSVEETLWDSANKLRGKVESAEYKHVVLGLIFLKFVSDKFEKRKQEIISEGKEKYLDMVEFYTSKNISFHRFHLTPNEWNTAKSLSDRYFVYRLYISKESKKLYILQDTDKLYKESKIDMMLNRNIADAIIEQVFCRTYSIKDLMEDFLKNG